MSNNEDDEITAEVIPFVAATVSPSNSGLQPFGITLEPQSLLTTTGQLFSALISDYNYPHLNILLIQRKQT